jgi:hypothetical protein
MDTAISNIRIWQIWKGCKKISAVAVYEDAATGERVNDFCHSLFRELGESCQISRELWPLSELRLPQLRAIAAEEAAQADVFILSLHHDESLPAEVKDMFDLWLGRQRHRPGVLIGLLDPVYQGTSAALRLFLKQAAERGKVEYRLMSDDSVAAA